MLDEEGPIHNQTEYETIEALAARKPPDRFELVVNRDTGIINSPTLEISWRFPDEVIALRPTHILVFLRYMSDDGQKKHHEERRVFPVSDALGYIPLHWAGKIHVFAWALSDEALRCNRCLDYSHDKTVKGLARFMTETVSFSEFIWNPKDAQLRGIQEDLLSSGYVYRKLNGAYQWNSDDHRLSFHRDNHFPLAAVAELKLQIPAQIFAPRPKTRLARALWKWVNLWHDQEPVDECAYDKRMIMAFLVQPSAMLVYWTAKYALGLLIALVVMTFRTMALASGFQPHLFLADVAEIILIKDYRYDFWRTLKNAGQLEDCFSFGGFRELRLGSWRFKAPLTIMELVCVAVFGYFLAYPEFIALSSPLGAVFAFLIIIGMIVIVATIWFYRALNGFCPKWREWLKKPASEAEIADERLERAKLEAERRAQAEKDAEAKRQKILREAELSVQKEREAEIAWLAENCRTHSHGRAPRPKPRKASLVKLVQLKFQNLKARICRPYDRGNKS